MCWRHLVSSNWQLQIIAFSKNFDPTDRRHLSQCRVFATEVFCPRRVCAYFARRQRGAFYLFGVRWGPLIKGLPSGIKSQRMFERSNKK